MAAGVYLVVESDLLARFGVAELAMHSLEQFGELTRRLVDFRAARGLYCGELPGVELLMERCDRLAADFHIGSYRTPANRHRRHDRQCTTHTDLPRVGVEHTPKSA